MDYKVDFAKQTERDLFSITRFLAEKNPDFARRLGAAPDRLGLDICPLWHRP